MADLEKEQERQYHQDMMDRLAAANAAEEEAENRRAAERRRVAAERKEQLNERIRQRTQELEVRNTKTLFFF